MDLQEALKIENEETVEYSIKFAKIGA